jgi:3-deoxy-manno-octulosonate cytidylyltransferase (CMP-KDO synthetase)
MNIVAVIPARYAATRFPGKLMQMLGKKPIIRHVYDNTVATGLFKDVFIVTDSDIIYKEIKGKWWQSDHEHTGTRKRKRQDS